MHDLACLGGIGVSIPTLLEDLDDAAGSDVNVLITGEPGVGKNAVAQLIHLQSGRAAAPLVTLDCAAGLRRENFARLEMARGGTILIDHVDEMTPKMQAQLMQFLENDRDSLDVRVIASADRSLIDRVAAGDFREELYYRLNVIHVLIPPITTAS